ncbi:MAG TPA: hypothetical protein VJA26_10870 [Gammaproteobacteria bacterium]|nr:hypothetical protein [Gammaproteobacteria bacterium]
MLRRLRTFLLICEAVIGFGPPAVLLLAGLPLLFLANSSLRLALAGDGDFDGVGVVLLYMGGVLGILGAVMLTYCAVRPSMPLRRARVILLLASCGVASLAAATSWLGLPVPVLLLSLAVVLHFVHIAREQPLPLTTTNLTRDVGIALLVIAIPVGALVANQDRLGARASVRDPCMEPPGRNMGLSFHVDLTEAEWPSFAATMRDFAREQALRLHDASQTYGDASNILYLSLCNDAGTQLMTNEHHYRIGPEWDWSVDNDVAVRVYTRDRASGWRGTADALERKLETTWPGRVTRTDSSPGTAD